MWQMHIFYNIWYEHGPFFCSVNTLGEPRKRRFYSYIFLQRTHLYVFQIFSWKELEKGGTVTAINAYFTLQISLKQQLVVVLTKATLSQERVLSRNDWDLKIQFSDNFESSQRAENTSLCGAEEQSLRAEVTWPWDVLILMSVNSPGPKDPPCWIH